MRFLVLYIYCVSSSVYIMQVPFDNCRKYYLRTNPNFADRGNAVLELVDQDFIDSVSTVTLINSAAITQLFACSKVDNTHKKSKCMYS